MFWIKKGKLPQFAGFAGAAGLAVMTSRRVIPIATATEAAHECDGAEAFALMVLGDSMAPEFREGEVIVVEPAGLATDGAYVLARVGDEWIFRRLARVGDRWELRPLNPAYPVATIDDLACVRGVVIQKSRPGRRKETKRYVD